MSNFVSIAFEVPATRNRYSKVCA